MGKDKTDKTDKTEKTEKAEKTAGKSRKTTVVPRHRNARKKDGLYSWYITDGWGHLTDAVYGPVFSDDLDEVYEGMKSYLEKRYRNVAPVWTQTLLDSLDVVCDFGSWSHFGYIHVSDPVNHPAMKLP